MTEPQPVPMTAYDRLTLEAAPFDMGDGLGVYIRLRAATSIYIMSIEDAERLRDVLTEALRGAGAKE